MEEQPTSVNWQIRSWTVCSNSRGSNSHVCGREGLIDLGMVFSRARRNGCVNVEALFRRASAPTWRGIRSYNVCCTGSDLTLRVCSVRERPNAVARTRPYCVPGLQMQVSGVRGKLTSNALFYFRQSGGSGGFGRGGGGDLAVQSQFEDKTPYGHLRTRRRDLPSTFETTKPETLLPQRREEGKRAATIW